MLVHIVGVLTQEQAASCRSALTSARWLDGRTSAGRAAATVKQNDEVDLTDPAARHWSETILRALGANKTFMVNAWPAKICPPSFNRYSKGQRYGTHNDAALFDFVQLNGRVWVRGDLSATLFLSEPDEYDGGELVIEDDFGIQRVKLAAGDLVLYPSSSQHRVEPVTRGERIACFLWMQSLVRDAQHRRLLHDLDDCIMELGQQKPDIPAAQRLVGIYHNLLRLWSDA
jgi:PKHD-type hydroxylase